LFPVSQWKAEILDFCPSTRILLIGCKTDLRTDVCTLTELSNYKHTPVSHEQVTALLCVESCVDVTVTSLQSLSLWHNNVLWDE